MYPDIPFETKSQAETNLFYLFRTKLSNEFIVIHSFSWLSSFISKQGYTDEKEIDFLILHEDYGILVLEVKGGLVKFDKYSYFSNGDSIKNPKIQAQGNMHALRDLISQEIHKNYTFGCAVSFPDIVFSKESIPIELRIYENPSCTNLLIDKSDLLNLEEKIIKIMQYWKEKFKKYHSKSNFKSIFEYLLAINPKELTLNDKIEYDNKQWLYLSLEQKKYLRYLIDNDSMYISGRAGTGKTVLAIILSRYLKKEKNQKVLFLTFNNLISNRIKTELTLDTDVMTFHSFLNKNVPRTIDIINKSDEALDYIIGNVQNEYDTLIIDETQSLKLRWLIKLKNYFLGNKKNVYLFADTIQSLFGEEKNTDKSIMDELAIEKSYTLTKNYRAPAKIHERLNEFFESNIELSSTREQTNKDLFEVFDDEPRNKVEDALTYLKGQNVSFTDVALLISGRAAGLASLKKDFYQKYPELTIETINKFRGMEIPIVIIVLAFENDLNELYVAYSRATTQVIVIVHKSLIYSMPDFANILLTSSITHNKTKELIKVNQDTWEKKYFASENKINHKPTTFQLYANTNFWVIRCAEKLTVESKLLIMYLNSYNESVIVFEDSILEKTKLFHFKDNNHPESFNYHSLKYEYCINCKEYTYNNKVFDQYYCNICTDSKNINRNIFKDAKQIKDKYNILNLITLYRELAIQMEDTQLLLFLDQVNTKYSLIACLELLKILIEEFKYNDKIELNYLRTHKYFENHHHLEYKWHNYCHIITSTLIKNNILEKEKQGTYRLKIN